MSEIQFECEGCDSLVRMVFPIIETGGTKKSLVCKNCDHTYVLEMSLYMELQKPRYKDSSWLNMVYSVEGKSMDEISKICGVSAMTIRKWLIKHGIPTRSVGQRLKE